MGSYDVIDICVSERKRENTMHPGEGVSVIEGVDI